MTNPSFGLGFVWLLAVVLTGANGMVILKQMIKNDTKTWMCNNKRINHPEIIQNAMVTCISRPGMYRNLCAYRELGIVSSDYKLDQVKIKEHFKYTIPDAKDAYDISQMFMLCESSKIE